MDIFIDLLPLIVITIGFAVCTVIPVLIDKFFDVESETLLVVTVILFFFTVIGGMTARNYRSMYFAEKESSYSDSCYTEIENLIQNGYVVYIDGSAVDSAKIVVSDYAVDKIYINDELKEIYISGSH